MIGRLSGRVGHIGPDHVLLDVGGVGYVVHISDRTRAALPAPGEPAMLYTELLVREDLLQLFGFPTPVEREWHRLLMSVQGIGAKASMAILGTLGAEGVGRAIALGDWTTIKAAPGVGPKIAQRAVNELKDKAPAFTGADPALATVSGALDAPRPTAAAEAVSALVNLGYGQSQAGAAVSAAMRSAGEDAATETLIRLGLKELAR